MDNKKIMPEELLQELHTAELEMLKAVDDLCRKHHITYTLYCGTLLGAIRHGGFIPWDDDIDLAMPMEDYKHFLKVAAELPAPYVMQNRNTTKSYPYAWSRVYADGTAYVKKGMKQPGDLHMGIWLDIYPFVGAAKTKWGQELQWFLIECSNATRTADLYRGTGDATRFTQKFMMHVPGPIRRAASSLCLWLAMRDPEKCETKGTLDAAKFEGKYKWSDWKEWTTARFEDGEFPIPVNYDGMLRIMYGDYMKLPPKEKRVMHRDENWILDLHKDYRDYLKEWNGK